MAEGAPLRAGLTVSLITPVHDGGEDFRRCLSSIAAAMPPPDEIIVVADGESDGSWRLAEQFGARVLRIPGPGGPARARNMGARGAQGDILFFVDADVTIPPDAVAQIQAAFRREPDLAAVFGSYDDEPAAGNFLSQYKNLLHHYVHQAGREEASTFWAGCGAIRRGIFFALGGFDERYRWPSIEDIELGYRLKRTGQRIGLCKSLQAKHLKRWGMGSMLTSDICRRALPWTELILRDRRLINDLNLSHSSRLSAVLICGLLAAIVAAPWWPRSLAVVGGLILCLLALYAPLYRFFRQKRGLWFALRAILSHWWYYLYSSLAFGIGIARHLFRSRRSPAPGPREAAEGRPDAERPREGRS